LSVGAGGYSHKSGVNEPTFGDGSEVQPHYRHGMHSITTNDAWRMLWPGSQRTASEPDDWGCAIVAALQVLYSHYSSIQQDRYKDGRERLDTLSKATNKYRLSRTYHYSMCIGEGPDCHRRRRRTPFQNRACTNI
jgi:hypothetical protein